MKALIKVGYACNQRCGFCHRLDLRELDGTREQVHSRIERARVLGHTMVVLSGGEPTIRPEIVEWAAHVAAAGMDFGLVTNGQMLAYPDLVERLSAHRLRYVYLSLHGGTAELHDSAVRSTAFERVRAALDNLRARELEVVVNTVVTTQNVEQLLPIVDLALTWPEVTYKLSMVEPRGGAARDFCELVPRVADVAARVREAIAYGLERRGDAGGPRFAHDGIPFCLLPGLEGLYDDLRTSGFASMIEVDETDFYPVDARGRIQPDVCAGCALRGACPGLYRRYYEEHGARELAPVHDRARSNSFHYAFERKVADADVERCPLLEGGVEPWDSGRTLFVRDVSGVALYRTRTRDFNDSEIAATKHDLGQVYLDVSEKAALDCFPDDLVKLERSRWCRDCPEQPRCTGMFERAATNSFARDDEVLTALLASMSGDVLDVGCGEGRYGEVLGPLANAGGLRYLGIEPDPGRAARLAEKWPWAQVRVATAEEPGDLGRAGFDWVLLLRSWNHLKDPAAAMRALRPRLHAGGRLVITDSVGFALARSAAQAARAESGPGRFEHLRNHTAAEVDRVVAEFGLRCTQRREVTPDSSSEWLLVYRAPPQ